LYSAEYEKPHLHYELILTAGAMYGLGPGLSKGHTTKPAVANQPEQTNTVLPIHVLPIHDKISLNQVNLKSHSCGEKSKSYAKVFLRKSLKSTSPTLFDLEMFTYIGRGGQEESCYYERTSTLKESERSV